MVREGLRGVLGDGKSLSAAEEELSEQVIVDIERSLALDELGLTLPEQVLEQQRAS